LLDAYLFVDDADALYAQYAAQGVEFTRGLGNMPWRCREFVIKDLRRPPASLQREPLIFFQGFVEACHVAEGQPG
jgi:hypothetical protein